MKLTLAFLAVSCALLAQSFADLVLTNGKLWTVNEARPQAEAVACVGPHIVAGGFPPGGPPLICPSPKGVHPRREIGFSGVQHPPPVFRTRRAPPAHLPLPPPPHQARL